MIELYTRDANNQRDIRQIAEISDLSTPKYSLISVHAGQNGAISTDRWNYAFGNGNEHSGSNIGEWGFVVAYDGYIDRMSLGMRLSNTADTEVMVTINGLEVGPSIIIKGTDKKNTVEFSQFQHKFSKGDTINFKTKQVGGGNDAVPVAFLMVDLTS